MKARTVLLTYLVVVVIASFLLFAPVIPVNIVTHAGVDASDIISWSSVGYYLFGFGSTYVHHCFDACIISFWSYEFA